MEDLCILTLYYPEGGLTNKLITITITIYDGKTLGALLMPRISGDELRRQLENEPRMLKSS